MPTPRFEPVCFNSEGHCYAALTYFLFCILLYSVFHSYLVLCLYCPAFCLFVFTYNTNIHAPSGI